MTGLNKSDENSSRLARGNSFFLRGEYENAIKEYQLALSAMPGLFLHYENIGWCYERLNDVVNAKEFYKKALELNPNAIRAKSFVERRVSASIGAKEGRPTFFPEIQKASAMLDKNPLKIEYFDKNLHMQEDAFVLVRIIGNDLYPRHKIGQSRENVEFILKNEPALNRCKKVWVVNRIFDKGEFEKIVSLLEHYKQEYYVLPFVEEEYRKIGFDYSCLPAPDYLQSKAFAKLSVGVKQKLFVAMLRLKNCYIMNNNGARNYALSLGKGLAKWVLPWDGNCFVNKASWEAITQDVLSEPYLRHFLVPMARITSNELMLNDDYVPEAAEEPQAVFRHDSKEKFNEDYCYGRRPKVELFWRLGIPGVWDTFKDDPWDQPRLPLSAEANQFSVAGWTARLFSGMAEQESQDSKGSSNRNAARQTAIVSAIDHIDKVCNREQVVDNALLSIKKTMNLNVGNDESGIEKLIKTHDNGRDFNFFCNRNDGLGERLKAILNTIVIAKLLERKFYIHWPEEVSAGKEFHSIDESASVFSKSFIHEHMVSKDFVAEKKLSHLSEIKHVKDFYSEDLFDGYLCHQNEKFKFFGESKVLDISLFGDAFEEIEFSQPLKKAILMARDIDIGAKAVAIHIRGGDIIYGRYRLSQRYQAKAICFPIVAALIDKLTQQGFKVVIFLQDEPVEQELRKECYGNVILAKDFSRQLDKTAQAIFDIILMSRCQIILAGTSGFAEVAARISGVKIKKVSDYLDVFQRLEKIKAWLSGEDTIDNFQHSFAILNYVLDGEGTLSPKEINEVLIRAEANDPSNGLYPAKRLLNFWNDGDFEAANRIARDHFEVFKGGALTSLPMFHTLSASTTAGLAMKKYYESLPSFDLNKFKELGIVLAYTKFLKKEIQCDKDCLSFLESISSGGGYLSDRSKYLLSLIR